MGSAVFDILPDQCFDIALPVFFFGKPVQNIRVRFVVQLDSDEGGMLLHPGLSGGAFSY